MNLNRASIKHFQYQKECQKACQVGIEKFKMSCAQYEILRAVQTTEWTGSS